MKDDICPICKKKLPNQDAQTDNFAPFCSEHCKMIDLGRWFTDGYVIPDNDLTDDQDDQ